jgi:hypothetical protein
MDPFDGGMPMAGTEDRNSHWRRSPTCSGYCADSACVEVRIGDDDVAFRNSERPEIVVHCTSAEWVAFLEGVKGGHFG